MDSQTLETVPKSDGNNHYYEIIKKTLHFLIPFSLISFLLSFTSFSSHNFHLLFPLFALDRKYIFLLCNGILAFLAKSLTFNTSSDSANQLEMNINKDEEEEENAGAAYLQDYPVEEKEVLKEEENGALLMKSEEEEKEVANEDEIGALLMDSEDGEEEEEEENEDLVGGTPAKEGNDQVNMNTEELNRKIEEFIRKMKEEIRIEAQQQELVPV